jgi:hypothetical protein
MILDRTTVVGATRCDASSACRVCFICAAQSLTSRCRCCSASSICAVSASWNLPRDAARKVHHAAMPQGCG